MTAGAVAARVTANMSRFAIASRAAVCGFAALLALPACITDDLDDPDVASSPCEPVEKGIPDRDQREALDEMGFCGSSAEAVEGGYVVEEDMFIANATLDDKHARSLTIVSAGQSLSMTVRVDASIPAGGGVDDWRAAVQTAVAAWNAVPLTTAQFVYTTAATADITFVADGGGLPNPRLAEATLPSGGRPGATILVNLDAASNRTFTMSQKTHAAAHELGHTIGFRHTNWDALGESARIHIPGTPDTDPDSVMNGATAGQDWMGLSTADRTALRLLYPERPTMSVAFTGCTGGTARMTATWNENFSHPVIQWQLDRQVFGNWSTVHSGTGRTFTFSVPIGQQLKIRVRGRTSEGWSQFRAVTENPPSCQTLPL